MRRDPLPSDAAPVAEATWLRDRALIVATFSLVTGGLAWRGGLPPTRLALLAGASALLVVYAVLGARQAAHGGPAPGTAPQFWMGLGCQIVIVSATGGLDSPLLPSFAGPAVVLAAGARSRRGLALVGGTALAAILAWALAPAPWLSVTLARPYRIALVAVALMMLVVHLGRTMLVMGARLDATARTLDDVRESLLQDAVERSRALEAIGAKVAHELRNPLAALKSLLQLERGAAARDARSERRFEVMTHEIGRMESILRDYLSYSRPLENLTLGPVDLAAIADHVVSVLEGRARAAGVQLVRTGPAVVLSADGRRLKEALLNLGANAIEATPRGGRVVVAVERLADAGRVSVQDTGTGMSAAVLEKIGTPFFTCREGGTGLGVVLARTVVEQHGGRLAFKSHPGQGTTATVTIPFEVKRQGGVLGEGAAG